ncbi:GLPGLI family protein [Urechidicola sp. KH5]
MNQFLKPILLTFLVTASAFAQDFQGKAVYQSKTQIELNLDSSQMSPEQKERIKKRMKDMTEKEFVLSFTKAESLYKEEEKLEQPGQSGGRMRFGGFGAGKTYKNTKDQVFLQEQNLMGKEFLVTDSLENYVWEFQDESKVIGQHLAFKAIAKKMVPNTPSFRFGRRGGNSQNSENDEPKDSLKEIEIVAWYTPEIPVSHGPGEYWGLPGLILEVNADNTTILCTKIVINPKEKAEIKAPKKGSKVTREEFSEIRIEKMKEMREMYGGRRSQGQQRRGI